MEGAKSPTMTTPSALVPVGLPVARVKIIMKSSPDIEHISPQALFLMTKATEHFVHLLAEEAKKKCNSTDVNYKNVSDLVEDDKFSFLSDVLPSKITVSEWRQKLKKRKNVDSSSESEESEDEEEEEEEESSSAAEQQQEESDDDDDDVVITSAEPTKTTTTKEDDNDVIVLSDDDSS